MSENNIIPKKKQPKNNKIQNQPISQNVSKVNKKTKNIIPKIPINNIPINNIQNIDIMLNILDISNTPIIYDTPTIPKIPSMTIDNILNSSYIIPHVNNSANDDNKIDDTTVVLENAEATTVVLDNIKTVDNKLNIDDILSTNLSIFDNKHHRTMFFVSCKTVIGLVELCTVHKIEIPIVILENLVTNIIPDIIRKYNGNIKQRYKKIIPPESICLGRKIDKKQCSRKKHNGNDFCKSHLRKLSNGRIDQPMQIINKSKRGRKRKVQFDPRQYDNEYVTLWEDLIEGHKVLVDKNNNIYSYHLSKPVFLGKKDINFKLDLEKLNIINTSFINETQNTETQKKPLPLIPLINFKF